MDNLSSKIYVILSCLSYGETTVEGVSYSRLVAEKFAADRQAEKNAEYERPRWHCYVVTSDLR